MLGQTLLLRLFWQPVCVRAPLPPMRSYSAAFAPIFGATLVGAIMNVAGLPAGLPGWVGSLVGYGEQLLSNVLHVILRGDVTATVTLHLASANRESGGSTESGVFTLPHAHLSHYPFVRLVSFQGYYDSSSTPSTAEINAANAGLLLSFDFIGSRADVISSSGRLGNFFVPLEGSVDNERVTVAGKDWRIVPQLAPRLCRYELHWAKAPTGISDSFPLEWEAVLQFSRVPWQ